MAEIRSVYSLMRALIRWLFSSDFSESDLQSWEYFASKAREGFGTSYQDNVDSIPTFIFNDKQYKDISEAFALAAVENDEISWADKDKVANFYNNAAGYNTGNNINIINGEEAKEAYTGIIGVLVHEYAHGIDKAEGGYVYSESLEYRQIYARAKLLSESPTEGFDMFPGYPLSERFVSSSSRVEDFAMAAEYYWYTGGDASKITFTPSSKKSIQERFDFLKKYGIVK